jgi:predicted ArsR family transcriptional regulator
MQKLDNSSMERQATELLKTSKVPCSISFVAKHLSIAWATARALLLNLTIQGKIKSQRTTTSIIFWVNGKSEVST